ncbi:hypothetical protein F5Y16DRAFT_212781 [Xylariaceae sp. FL0255]|nr:hypothetical protein F5Y16DRAFT_212781 [Xylariaceae sp. FL0255]
MMFWPTTRQKVAGAGKSQPGLLLTGMQSKRHSGSRAREFNIEQQLGSLSYELEQNRRRLDMIRHGLVIPKDNQTPKEHKIWFPRPNREAPTGRKLWFPGSDGKVSGDPDKSYVYLQDLRGHGPLFAKTSENLNLQYDALSELCDYQAEVLEMLHNTVNEVQLLKQDHERELQQKKKVLQARNDGSKNRLTEAKKSTHVLGDFRFQSLQEFELSRLRKEHGQNNILKSELIEANIRVARLREKQVKAEKELSELREELAGIKNGKSEDGGKKVEKHEGSFLDGPHLVPVLLGCAWTAFALNHFWWP